MFFDLKIETKGDELNARVWMKNSCGRERRGVSRSCGEGKDPSANDNRTGESSWPDFAHEDYIEFCFGEDGEFDLVKDGKSEASNHVDFKISTSSKSVNRKLKFGENDNERWLNEDGNGVDPTISGVQEVDEKYEKFYKNIDSASNNITTYQIVDKEECRMVPVKSSDSNSSNDSTNSFNFPVLSREWYGSPVKMPQSQAFELRKQKARCVGFQCWRS